MGIVKRDKIFSPSTVKHDCGKNGKNTQTVTLKGFKNRNRQSLLLCQSDTDENIPIIA